SDPRLLATRTEPAVVEVGDHRKHSISNISPSCSETGTVASPSTATEFVVTSQSRDLAFVPVSWVIVDTCRLCGTFQARLAMGTCSLSLANFLQDPRGVGCSE